jgi:hypothetical protein
MNNDLKKLSDNELRLKQNEISDGEKYLQSVIREKGEIYNKLLRKRWTNPLRLLTLQSDIDLLQKTKNLLNEYYRTITDEINTRLQSEKNISLNSKS